MKKTETNQQVVNRVGITTIIWNIFLSVIKMIVGILAKSASMISDSIHSASDIFTTVIVMIGAKISAKESDQKHPYGHERFESIASIFLAILLAATALGIGYAGIKNIINQSYKLNSSNNFVILALFGAILSIIVKGVMYFYTNNAAKRIKSNSLKADAWHHLSDSLSSIGSMLGIIGMMIGKGWQIMDPIAAVIICLVIVKVAFDISKVAINQLVDKSISSVIADEMIDIVKRTEGVIDVVSFKSRQFSNKIYIDIEIYVDENLSLLESNDISIKVHDCLENHYDDLKHCTVWAKPYLNIPSLDIPIKEDETTIPEEEPII